MASSSIEKIGESEIRVTGDLTMFGVTKAFGVDLELNRKSCTSRACPGFRPLAKTNRLAFRMNSGLPAISRELDLVVTSKTFEQ